MPLKSLAFWIELPLLLLLGGFAVFVYEHSNVTFTPILALHVGASAPVLFQQFLSTVSPVGKAG